MKCSESRSVVSDSLLPHGLYSPRNSPGQNTGAGSLSLLQGIFPTQGSNSGLPHCRQILYQLSHKGSPRILERVAYPFSSASSWPRNRTGVSFIAGGFFTNWTIREAHNSSLSIIRLTSIEGLLYISFNTCYNPKETSKSYNHLHNDNNKDCWSLAIWQAVHQRLHCHLIEFPQCTYITVQLIPPNYRLEKKRVWRG